MSDSDENRDEDAAGNAMFSSSIDRLKESFLLATAVGGSAQDCESLLKLGADVNFRGADDETPLLGATRRGHFQAGEVLIVHGADCNAKGRDSLTPLHVAAKRGDMSMLNVLLNASADPSVKTSDGKTAFELAKSKGYEDICQRLLDHRNNPHGVSSSSFNTRPVNSPPRRAESSQEQQRMYADQEGVTLRSDGNSSSSSGSSSSRGEEQKVAPSRVNARPPSSSSSMATVPRESGVHLIGDQFPAVAPAKIRPGSAAAARSIEEKRIAEAERASKTIASSSSSALTSGKLTEHATLVYRDEKEAQMMDATRALLDAEMKLKKTEEQLQIAQDENAAQQLRMEEAMIENAVSGKEVESLKEQFFRMKEYLQQLNEEMGLLRGEEDAIVEITSVGECERLEKILKTTLSKVEERKSGLIANALNKTSDEQKLCVVCIDAEKSVLLLPCRHVCVCKLCSRQIDSCPVCRAQIQDKINVFM